MQCPKCHTELPAEARYCFHCGSSLAYAAPQNMWRSWQIIGGIVITFIVIGWLASLGRSGASMPALPATTGASTASARVAPTTLTSSPRTSFGDGTYRVGQDVLAGTYHTSGGDVCYWARLSGLGGTQREIIANELARGPSVVTIQSDDAGFLSRGCGTWQRVS